MKTNIGTPSPVRLARTAGFLYLLVVPLGIFGAMYVPSSLIVAGDAATTTRNIIASESLFRLGMVSHILAPLLMLGVALVLHLLLKPVDGNIAVAMVILVMLGISTDLVNRVNQFAALRLLSGAEYLKVFTTEQLQASALLLLQLPGSIAMIFWGLWLFPLGYLVFRSGFIPRIIGILLMISCFAYLVDTFSSFLGYTISIGMFGALGEIVLILWLLVKGVNAEQWKRRAFPTR